MVSVEICFWKGRCKFLIWLWEFFLGFGFEVRNGY